MTKPTLPWWKRIGRVLMYAGGSLLLLGIAYFSLMSYLDRGVVSYEITANALDTWAVDSYPQKLGKQDFSQEPPVFLVTTHSGKDRIHSGPRSENYPREVAIYLQPSARIESDSADIKVLADSIAPGERDVVAMANAAAQWTAKNLCYDFQLSRQIWNGEIATQSALETIKRRRGTCSEYANVFIGIMRSKGIPARYVMGKMYLGAYHSWAEIWLEGQGWVPVDPQRGTVGITARHIKLFAGADFEDIGVPLKNIRVKIKRLGRERP